MSCAGGFNFDLVQRNALLKEKGMQGPGFTKTGTTIAGIIFKVRVHGHGVDLPGPCAGRLGHAGDLGVGCPATASGTRPSAPTPSTSRTVLPQDGVVLGADTRSTAGSTVADKNCEKIHYIAPNIYCCGAGTAADTENVTGMVSSQLVLHRYGTGRASRVVTAMTMLKGHLFQCAGCRGRGCGGGAGLIGCGEAVVVARRSRVADQRRCCTR